MVGVGEGLAGVLAIKDPLKPEARGVVAALHQAGMACHLVTGDNWRTARSIAEQLGIINVTAECLPAGKAEKIKVNLHCFSSILRNPYYYKVSCVAWRGVRVSAVQWGVSLGIPAMLVWVMHVASVLAVWMLDSVVVAASLLAMQLSGAQNANLLNG